MAGKGDDFERTVCRRLSLWWTKGEFDDVLWRNPTRAVRQVRKAEMQLGDIRATDDVAMPLTNNFLFECKNGYSIKKTTKKGVIKKEKARNVPWDLLDCIDGKQGTPTIMMFWEQTVKEAKLANKTPVLIFKRDFHTPVICIADELYMEIEGLTWVEGTAKINTLACLTASIEGVEPLNFFSLEAFLQLITPEDFVRVIKAREGIYV